MSLYRRTFDIRATINKQGGVQPLHHPTIHNGYGWDNVWGVKIMEIKMKSHEYCCSYNLLLLHKKRVKILDNNRWGYIHGEFS